MGSLPTLSEAAPRLSRASTHACDAKRSGEKAEIVAGDRSGAHDTPGEANRRLRNQCAAKDRCGLVLFPVACSMFLSHPRASTAWQRLPTIESTVRR